METRTTVNAVVIRNQDQALAIIRGLLKGDLISTGKAPATLISKQGGFDESRLVIELSAGRQIAYTLAQFQMLLLGRTLTVTRPETPERLREQRLLAYLGDDAHTVTSPEPTPVKKARKAKA